jgi:hypothetical protein
MLKEKKKISVEEFCFVCFLKSRNDGEWKSGNAGRH